MPSVQLGYDGPLAVITLDAPPLNLFGPELASELHAAIDQVATNRAVRGLRSRSRSRATC
jgi:enoyl-CoA hydratase/carnithine racemase